jgi:hypothetical protein
VLGLDDDKRPGHNVNVLAAVSATYVAARSIEPLGSIIFERSNPEIADRSQVFSPRMIDSSGQ